MLMMRINIRDALLRVGRKQWSIAFWGGLLLVSAVPAYAMNCGAARSPVERMVCSDKSLMELDVRLNDVYRVLSISAQDSSNLREEQRRWLTGRDACLDVACVRESYTDRVQSLRQRIATPDIWVREMPDRFRDGWLFFSGRDTFPGDFPGEPFWLIPANGKVSETGVGSSAVARQQTAHPLQRGIEFELFGFYSGSVRRARVEEADASRLVLKGREGTVALYRFPASAIPKLSTERLTANSSTDEFASKFQSTCLPFWSVIRIRRQGLDVTEPLWYGARNSPALQSRDRDCEIPDISVSFDGLFGVAPEGVLGDGAAHVLADGSMLLVSAWPDVVHVIRVGPDGHVPAAQRLQIKAVSVEQMKRARREALKLCTRRMESEQSDKNLPNCLVEQVEKNI